MNTRLHRALLAALILVHAAETTWVAMADRTPPYLAIIDHQARADAILRELQADPRDRQPTDLSPSHAGRPHHPSGPPQPSLFEPVAITLRACNYRPPLPMVAALPGMAAWPERPSAGGIAGVLWIAILLSSAYGIGLRLGDPTTGIVAAVLVGAFPAVLGHRALVLPFLPSAAFVAAFANALLALRAAERFGAARVGMWAGFAMLCRWDAAVPLGGLLAWHLATTPRGERRAVLRSAWAAVPAFVLAGGWWYPWGVARFVPFYLGQGILATQHSHEGIALFSFENAFYYPWRLVDTLSGVLAIPCALALAWLLRRRPPALGLLASWIGVSWAFYLVVPMKGARYALPVLCPIAVALALAARAAGPRWRALLVAVAIAQHLSLTHLPGFERAYNGGVTDPAAWSEHPNLWEASLEGGRLRPMTDPAWWELLRAMERAMGAPFARAKVLLMADEGPSEYLASLEMTPRLALNSPTELPDGEIDARVSAAHFIVISTPARPVRKSPDELDERRERVRAAAEAEVQHRALIYEGSLPDGTRVALYGARR